MEKLIDSSLSLTSCPECKSSRFLTKLSSRCYFCLECLVELKVSNNKVFIMEISEDGKAYIKKHVMLNVI